MLGNHVIESVLEAALSTGGDFAEIFVEDRIDNTISLIGGKIEKSLSGRDYGVGIRLFKGLNSIYVYTNDASKENLIEVAKKGAFALNKDLISTNLKFSFIKSEIENNHKILISPNDILAKEKVDYMKKAYHIAKNYDEIITQVKVNYLDNTQHIFIANSEGLKVKDTRTRSRISIQSVASYRGEMQTGSYNPGAHKGFEFIKNLDLDFYAKEASRIAKTMAYAKPCPSGKFPVIIDNEFGGVIFHEACGHGLEATSVAKGNSIFAGKLGQQVASPMLTAIDDGTLPNEWGSSTIDDEGNKTQKNVLIENGILKGYLIDKLNGRRMNMSPTGSSRRESYKFAPTSRMTNTFIDNGKSTKEEIISSTEFGIFAKYMGGGSVNTATGDFNFAVMEGYMVRDGKIEEPVRGATLIGNGGQVLKDIDMIGNNLGHGQGMCGSVSGSIPANVGQPVLRVKSITVGGKE